MTPEICTLSGQGTDWFKYLSPVASILISGAVTAFFFRRKRNDDYLAYLDKQIDEILKIAVSLPHFEYSTFCDAWESHKAKESSAEAISLLQYNIYTNLVFNYCARLCQHYNYKEKHFLRHTDIKAWLRMHRKAWNDPLNGPNENIDSYDEKFVAIVRRYL